MGRKWDTPSTPTQPPEATNASFRSCGASYVTLDPPFSKPWIRPLI